MSQEFLARILEQKAREVEQMELEQIQPLRQTYRLAEFLKNHQRPFAGDCRSQES